MLAWPVVLNAQAKSAPVSPAVPSTARVFKRVAASDISPMAGTSLSPIAAYQGFACGGLGCVVAKAAAGGQAVISIHLGGGKVRATEFRTGIIVSHGVKHSVEVSLNGTTLAEFSCDESGTLQAKPNFAALGASNAGFGWQSYDGAKLVNSGHSTGEAVKFDVMSHTAIAAPMELAISDRGVLEIVHGATRIVLTPDDKDGIGAKTKGYVTFEDLGLRVTGPAEFAVVNSMLKF
jgi:hypothetical protein